MKCVHETEHGICEIDNDLCHNGLCRIKEPQTNADRIRSMSDEELAIFLGFVIQDGYCYGAKLRDELKIIPVSDYSEMVEWLKAEATDEK